MAIEPDFWLRRRVLVTGHTGFKGAWLSLWLQALGAEVTGVARGPAREDSMYTRAAVGEGMSRRALDVCDAQAMADTIASARAEVVFHLAGQPVVRRSLRDPAGTYAANVMGTVGVLEGVRRAGGVRAVVVVTSDKCYENDGATRWPFRERDPLGGGDPYSSSKACAELVAAAYRSSLLADPAAARLATARAGNVIGGGDRGEDRLLPDAVRAVEGGVPLRIRNPGAVRPWQHVLGPLAGYLLLARALWDGEEAARPWNFGPPAEQARTVGWIVGRLAELWQGELRWERDSDRNPPEAEYLALDSSAARQRLGWRSPWDLDRALQAAVEWHRGERAGESMRELSLAQIEAFATELGSAVRG